MGAIGSVRIFEAVNVCNSMPVTFYLNVTTLRSGLCYAVANPSVVCNVRAPYSRVKTFGNISSPFCSIAILWPPCKILRSSQRSPSVEGVKRKTGSKIERCHVRVSHLLMSFLSRLISTTLTRVTVLRIGRCYTDRYVANTIQRLLIVRSTDWRMWACTSSPIAELPWVGQ